MNNNYSVYIHINLYNDKKYVGITRQQDVNKRWQKGNGYSNNRHFFSAINKYGWDRFSHIIIFSGCSEEEARDVETLLITTFDTINPNFGYNKTTGGRKGYERTEEWKAHMREINSGEKNPCYGKKLTIEHRNKISEGNKGKGHNKEWREIISQKAKKTAVICVNTGQKFDSQKEAGLWCGIKGKPGKIGECCRGTRFHCGKHPDTNEPLSWVFFEEGDL